MLKDQMKQAMQMAYDICKSEKSQGVMIPDDDMAILLKYEGLKLIKLTLPKFKLSDVLYFPTIQHDLYRGMTQNTWVKIMLWATKSFNIKCNVTLASVASYRASPHDYKFIEPVIVIKSDIGTLAYKEEDAMFLELKEEF